jgi:hypothetical protein
MAPNNSLVTLQCSKPMSTMVDTRNTVTRNTDRSLSHRIEAAAQQTCYDCNTFSKNGYADTSSCDVVPCGPGQTKCLKVEVGIFVAV